MTLTSPNIITRNGKVYKRVAVTHDEVSYLVMERGERKGLTRNRSTLGKAAMQQVRHLRHRGRKA